MGQREVSETAELSATEAAERLLSILKEYSPKLAIIAEHGSGLLEKLAIQQGQPKAPSALEAGRLICLHNTLEKPVTDLARTASGLLEHSSLEPLLRAELKLRLDELEEDLRFASVIVGELTERVVKNKTHAEWLRQLIKKSGRYESPF